MDDKMDTFLTDAELRYLTGFIQPKKQAEQCRRLGIPFFTNARGRPVVSRDIINAKPPKKAQAAWQPDIP